MKYKRFQSSLEPLLRLRTIEEELAMQELGEVLSKINAEKEKLRILEEQYQQELEKLPKMIKMPEAIQFYRTFEAFLNRIENQKKSVEKLIAELQPELEEKRKKLVEKTKNRKIVETLIQNQKNEYEKQLKKSEQKELFELNQNNIYSMKQKEDDKDIKKTLPKRPDKKETTRDLQTRRREALQKFYQQRGISL
ncbi:MAG: flagellar export protein FliJ [Leptospiraceae bacterium]|nr:flagellar export protein FliJ [Leptospiraceae bacterium]MDW7976879.1 flagellar export protein FliJ [Leptospiraceae bacterium]